MDPNFDMRRYAEVQEHGLRSGGGYSAGPKDLCALQAYSYCMNFPLGESLVATPERGMHRLPYREWSNLPGFDFLVDRITYLNDMGTDEDREWLLSILPELPRFHELFAARSRKIADAALAQEEPCLTA